MCWAWRAATFAWAGGTALGLAAAPPVGGQEAPGRRTLLVNVLDREGRMVAGLDATRFRGEYRGRPVRILSAREDRSSRLVAVVVDVSGSQNGRALAAAWRAVESLAGGLAPQHRVVVLTVADALRRRSELTTDRAVLLEAVGRARAVEPWGPSALRDGVLQAARAFGSPGPWNAVCLVSDGVDTASAVSSDQLEKAVAASGARVFVVETDSLRPWGAVSAEERRWTKAITEATGGLVVRVRTSDTSEDAVAAVRSSISDAYRLEVDLGEPVDKPRRWTLEATTASGERRKDVRLVYPRTVAPPDTPVTRPPPAGP